MLIKNGKIFRGMAFAAADIRFGRTIQEIGPQSGPGDFDAADCYVIPGLVDIHTHGAMGEDFSDGKPAGLQPMADYYAAHGVTSFLATTMTLKEETLTPARHARASIWRGPSSVTPSGGPRRRKICTSRTCPSSGG